MKKRSVKMLDRALYLLVSSFCKSGKPIAYFLRLVKQNITFK